MAVRMAGVEMVDRDPVEASAEVLLHLPHEVAGEGAHIRESVAVLGGDNEAELVTIFPAALRKGAAVGIVGLGAVEPPSLALPGRAVALEIADVSIGRPAAHLQLDDPRLDDDPPHPRARPAVAGRPLEPIGRLLASADPAAPSLPGLPLGALRRRSPRICESVSGPPLALAAARNACVTKG
jgi:hypothetical protein